MRLYLEALENAQDLEAEFIRIDITGMNEAEVKAVKTSIEDIMVGKDYKLLSHECKHDEGKGCTIRF